MMARGFTLIEVLIVMVIISIVGAVAILSITQNQNSRLESLSKEMANMITLAETQALIQPAVIGFALTSNAYQFYRYQEPTQENENGWQPLGQPPLTLRSIPKGIEVTLKIQDKVVPPAENIADAKPQLIISTSGDITPFVIFIGKTGSPPRYRIIGNENGGVNSEKIP